VGGRAGGSAYACASLESFSHLQHSALCARTHTRSPSQPLAYTPPYTHTHTYTHTHIHACAHTHARARAHTHTQTTHARTPARPPNLHTRRAGVPGRPTLATPGAQEMRPAAKATEAVGNQRLGGWGGVEKLLQKGPRRADGAGDGEEGRSRRSLMGVSVPRELRQEGDAGESRNPSFDSPPGGSSHSETFPGRSKVSLSLPPSLPPLLTLFLQREREIHTICVYICIHIQRGRDRQSERESLHVQKHTNSNKHNYIQRMARPVVTRRSM